jgi:hypothetical protein
MTHHDDEVNTPRSRLGKTADQRCHRRLWTPMDTLKNQKVAAELGSSKSHKSLKCCNHLELYMHNPWNLYQCLYLQI